MDWDNLGAETDVVPYNVSDIENNWGNRHLFRLPYSVHDGSSLVSLPLKKEELTDFKKQDAAMENVDVETTFLDSYEEEEAKELIKKALDWFDRQSNEEKSKRYDNSDFSVPDDAIPEEYFPPTIHNILGGLEDGRKRAVFILVTFLAHCGYDWETIQQMLWQWNDRNDEPLSERYIETQLNWHKRQDEPLMPPNWESDGFYQELGVYEEDPLTEQVSNPVAYAFARRNDEDDATDDAEDGDDDSGSEKEIVECPYCGKEYKGETKWYKDHVMECTG